MVEKIDFYLNRSKEEEPTEHDLYIETVQKLDSKGLLEEYVKVYKELVDNPDVFFSESQDFNEINKRALLRSKISDVYGEKFLDILENKDISLLDSSKIDANIISLSKQLSDLSKTLELNISLASIAKSKKETEAVFEEISSDPTVTVFKDFNSGIKSEVQLKKERKDIKEIRENDELLEQIKNKVIKKVNKYFLDGESTEKVFSRTDLFGLIDRTKLRYLKEFEPVEYFYQIRDGLQASGYICDLREDDFFVALPETDLRESDSYKKFIKDDPRLYNMPNRASWDGGVPGYNHPKGFLLIDVDKDEISLNGKVVYKGVWDDICTHPEGVLILKKNQLSLNGETVLYEGEISNYKILKDLDYSYKRYNLLEAFLIRNGAEFYVNGELIFVVDTAKFKVDRFKVSGGNQIRIPGVHEHNKSFHLEDWKYNLRDLYSETKNN